MNPIRIMILANLISDLDETHDYLVDRCADGANDEFDRLGGMADAIAAAANLLFALKYGS
jgi:hypothetical protein